MSNNYCVGGRHMSETINQKVYEKVNPKTNKVVKFIKRKCIIGGRNKSQIFTEQCFIFIFFSFAHKFMIVYIFSSCYILIIVYILKKLISFFSCVNDKTNKFSK